MHRVTPQINTPADEPVDLAAVPGASAAFEGSVVSYSHAVKQRVLAEVELWEVSLVTFPMLPEAKVGRKSGDRDDVVAADEAAAFSAALRDAARALRGV